MRAPIPPGRYRFAFDLVAEHRAWFSELGSETASADVDVLPRPGAPRAELPGLGRADARARRSASPPRTPRATRVVAGAIAWHGGLGRRRPRALAPYEPGPGRIPGFPHPLLCPSVLRRRRARAAAGRRRPAGVRRAGRGAVALRRTDRARRGAGPAVRVVVPRTGQSSIAIRSSIRRKTSRPEGERDDRGDREVDPSAAVGAWPSQSASRTASIGGVTKLPQRRTSSSVCGTARSPAASRSSTGSASGRTTAGAPPPGCARRRGGRRSGTRRAARCPRRARRRAAQAGSTSQTVARAPGTKMSERTIRIASITANVTACVATTEKATSCRGKRTFLISSALSTIERAAVCSDTAKKIQQAMPGEQVQRVVRDLAALVEQQAEDDQVDRHERERVDERPERSRAPSRGTSPGSRGGRGSRTARGSGRGRRRRPSGAVYAVARGAFTPPSPEGPAPFASRAAGARSGPAEPRLRRRSRPEPPPTLGRWNHGTARARCPLRRNRGNCVPVLARPATSAVARSRWPRRAVARIGDAAVRAASRVVVAAPAARSPRTPDRASPTRRRAPAHGASQTAAPPPARPSPAKRGEPCSRSAFLRPDGKVASSTTC